MPNKTIYIADEDLPVFQKAQEVAGESISKVIAQALRQYIIQKNLEGTDLKEFEAQKGHIGPDGVNVVKVRFIGKKLSDTTCGTEEGLEYTYTLYHTRKSQFLLQIKTADVVHEDTGTYYDYEVIEDFIKLYNRNLPTKLIKDAEDLLGNEHIRFIDI